MKGTSPEWAALYEQIKQARKAAGYPKRAPFAEKIGINDSTMAIAEGARQGPLSDDMLDFITIKLGWTVGEWRQRLAGATSTADRQPPGRPSLADLSTADLLAELARRTGVLEVSPEAQRQEQAGEENQDTEGGR